jgi:hypothetical protein
LISRSAVADLCGDQIKVERHPESADFPLVEVCLDLELAGPQRLWVVSDVDGAAITASSAAAWSPQPDHPNAWSSVGDLRPGLAAVG